MKCIRCGDEKFVQHRDGTFTCLKCGLRQTKDGKETDGTERTEEENRHDGY